MQLRCDTVEISARPRTAGLACIHCGCTDDRACPGGCSWVSIDPPVCSACVDSQAASEADAPQLYLAGDTGFFRDQLCPGSSTPALHAPLLVDEKTGYCARCQEGFVL